MIKQLNGKKGQTLAGKLHTQSITAIKAKNIYSKPLELIKQSITPTNEEPDDDGTSKDFKIFQQVVGLPNDAPVVIMNSEFLPIYQGGSLNEVGSALNIKEQSKILTAKNAITVLTKVPDFEKYVDENVKKINILTDVGEDLITDLFTSIINVNQNLNTRRDVRYPTSNVGKLGTSFGAKKNVAQQNAMKSTAALMEQVAEKLFFSLSNYLQEKSFSLDDIDEFSNTKLWLQALVELKYTLSVASVGLSNSKITERTAFADIDKDPNLISLAPGELITMDNGKPGTYWLNNRLRSTITISDILNGAPNINAYRTNVVDPIIQLISYDGVNDIEKCLFTNQPGGAISVSLFSETPSAETGTYAKYMAVLSNILQREKDYSKNLKNLETTLSNDYGFNISNEGNNTAVWDYLVGRFTSNAQEFVENPTGNGRSLVSLSNAYYPAGNNENYKVLTFERNFPKPNEYAITPGLSYYIDASLSTQDGKSFNTQNVKLLRQKLNYALQSISTIENFVNLDTGIQSENYLVRKLANRFSAVSRIYNSCFELQSNGDNIFNKKLLKNNSDEDTRIRFFSVISRKIVEKFGDSYSDTAKMIANLYIMCIIYAEAGKDDAPGTFASSTNYKNAVDEFTESALVMCDVNSYGQTEIKGISYPGYVYGLYEKTTLSADSFKQFFIKRDKFWIEFMNLFKEEYDQLKKTQNTQYSGIDKHLYLLMFLLDMLMVIASMTPESCNRTIRKNDKLGLGNWIEGLKEQVESTTGKEVPFETEDAFVSDFFEDATQTLLSSYSYVPTATYFDWYKVNKEKNTIIAKQVTQATDLMRDEMNEIFYEVRLFKYFINNIKTSVDNLVDILEKNFTGYLQRILPIYASNTELTQKQKDALFNMSLSEEQLKMTKYILSEIDDRIAENDSESKLATFPAFFDFPKKFGKFIPLNDSELLSFTTLSTYFKSKEFEKLAGGNKRIITVGIPPGMINNFELNVPRTAVDRILQNIVQVRIWKVDLLNPLLFFTPQSFLFEMNRFPTRCAANWDYSAFAEEANLLQIPTKYFINSQIEVHRNYNEAFRAHETLDEQRKTQIYTNHVKSYLIEEYIRWFTDVHVDETRYYNYDPMQQSIKLIEDGYNKFVEILSFSKGIATDDAASTSSKSNVKAIFKSLSGAAYKVILDASNQDKLSNSVNKAKKQSESTKPFDLEMSETMKSFLSHETLMMPYAQLANRVAYPKKFDRTFSILFDPDDFVVDVTTIRNGNDQQMKDAIEKMIAEGLLISNTNTTSGQKPSNQYKMKQMTQNDVYMNEYFVTIEPYVGSNRYLKSNSVLNKLRGLL